MSWSLERPRGSVFERHHNVPDLSIRSLRVHEIEKPTLVVGSSQNETVALGKIPVVRRRTGGGAVLLRPGEVFWVDVTLPRQDPLWVEDITHSTLWLGDVWRRTFLNFNLPADMHRGAMIRNRWSDRVCFAGKASGEVVVEGKKILGISQRRTRVGAWFQCAVLFEWPVHEIVDLLELIPKKEAKEELLELASSICIDATSLLNAFRENLPTN